MPPQLKHKFLELLETSDRPLLADGAMGTMLNMRGIGFEVCFDALNLENPAYVAEVHREYIEAGAQIILTNTFGANHFKLAEHGIESKVSDINRAGVELAHCICSGVTFCFSLLSSYQSDRQPNLGVVVHGGNVVVESASPDEATFSSAPRIATSPSVYWLHDQIAATFS